MTDTDVRSIQTLKLDATPLAQLLADLQVMLTEAAGALDRFSDDTCETYQSGIYEENEERAADFISDMSLDAWRAVEKARDLVAEAQQKLVDIQGEVPRRWKRDDPGDEEE